MVRNLTTIFSRIPTVAKQGQSDCPLTPTGKNEIFSSSCFMLDYKGTTVESLTGLTPLTAKWHLVKKLSK